MKALAFLNKSPSAAMGVGFTISSPGTYNAGTTYNAGDVVKYVVSGVTKYYGSLQGSNTGHTPNVTNSTFWVEIDGTYGIPVLAQYAVIQTETKGVRWRDDGVDPTAAIGQLLPPISVTTPVVQLVYNIPGLRKLKIIEVGASALVNVTFYSN